MTGGKEFYNSLAEYLRRADFRRFRIKHRTNRWAEILGYGPDGRMVGYWDGSQDIQLFDPAEICWTRLVTYS